MGGDGVALILDLAGRPVARLVVLRTGEPRPPEEADSVQHRVDEPAGAAPGLCLKFRRAVTIASIESIVGPRVVRRGHHRRSGGRHQPRGRRPLPRRRPLDPRPSAACPRPMASKPSTRCTSTSRTTPACEPRPRMPSPAAWLQGLHSPGPGRCRPGHLPTESEADRPGVPAADSGCQTSGRLRPRRRDDRRGGAAAGRAHFRRRTCNRLDSPDQDLSRSVLIDEASSSLSQPWWR